MYAVKVVLLPSPDTAFRGGPGPPSEMPDDQRLDAVAQCTRTAPQPGIAHVTLTRWGRRLVGMTFVEADGLDDAVKWARSGWNRWLSLPGLLPGWALGECRPDRYLSAPAHTRRTDGWLA